MFKTYPYTVTCFLDGRHPYREPGFCDYPDRTVHFTVQARSWNHAEKVAWRKAADLYMPFWACKVLSIAQGDIL